MASDLRTKKRLDRLRQQADALLELTQAINRNVPDSALFALFQRCLESMGVGKLALFSRRKEETVWGCLIEWGYPTSLPKLANASEVLSGKAHAIVDGDTEVEFDLAIPVEHDGDVIAYVVMGTERRGGA